MNPARTKYRSSSLKKRENADPSSKNLYYHPVGHEKHSNPSMKTDLVQASENQSGENQSNPLKINLIHPVRTMLIHP